MARRPFVPAYSQNINYNYPKPEHDISKIKELFQKVSSYDINDVVNYVNENRMTWDVLGDDNATLLFAVLDNELDSPDQNARQYRMVDFLISKGVNINHANKYGLTPLHLAIAKQKTKVATLLINSGADLILRDSYLSSYIHYAVIGSKKKYEKDRTIGAIVPEEPDSSKINKNMKGLVAETIRFLRSDDIQYYEGNTFPTDTVLPLTTGVLKHANPNKQIKLIMNSIQKYSNDNKTMYRELVLKGYSKNITQLLGKYTGQNEQSISREFLKLIDNLVTEIKGDMNQKFSSLTRPNIDNIISVYESKTSQLDSKNFTKPIPYSIEHLKDSIVAQDRKIYSLVDSAITNYKTNMTSVVNDLSGFRTELFGVYNTLYNDFFTRRNPAGIVSPPGPVGQRNIGDPVLNNYQGGNPLPANTYVEWWSFMPPEVRQKLVNIPPASPVAVNVNTLIYQNEAKTLPLRMSVDDSPYPTLYDTQGMQAQFDSAENTGDTDILNYFQNRRTAIPSIPPYTVGIAPQITVIPKAPWQSEVNTNTNIYREYGFDYPITIDAKSVQVTTATPFVELETLINQLHTRLNNDESVLGPILSTSLLLSKINESTFFANDMTPVLQYESCKRKYEIDVFRIEQKDIDEQKDIADRNNQRLGDSKTIYDTLKRQVITKDVKHTKIGKLIFDIPALLIPCDVKNEKRQGSYFFRDLSLDAKNNSNTYINRTPDTNEILLGTNNFSTNYNINNPPSNIGQNATMLIADIKSTKFESDSKEPFTLQLSVGSRIQLFDSTNTIVQDVYYKSGPSDNVFQLLTTFFDYSYLRNANSSMLDNLVPFYETIIRMPEHDNPNFLANRRQFYLTIYDVVSRVNAIKDSINTLIHGFDRKERITGLQVYNINTQPIVQRCNGVLTTLDTFISNVQTFYKNVSQLVPEYTLYDSLKFSYHSFYDGNVPDDYFRDMYIKYPLPNKHMILNSGSSLQSGMVPFDPVVLSPISYNVTQVTGVNRYFMFTTPNHTTLNTKVDSKMDYPIVEHGLDSQGQTLKLQLADVFQSWINSNVPESKTARDEYRKIMNSFEMSDNEFSSDPTLYKLKQLMFYKIFDNILSDHFNNMIHFFATRYVSKLLMNKQNGFSLDNEAYDSDLVATDIYERLVKVGLEMVKGLAYPIESKLDTVSDSIAKYWLSLTLPVSERDSKLKNNVGLAQSLDSTPPQEILYSINYTDETPTVERSVLSIDSQILLTLLNNGLQPNIKNSDGNTPLHLAFELQNTKVIRILLKKHALLDSELTRNNKGLTPYSYNHLLFANHVSVMSNIDNFTQTFYKKFEKSVFDKPSMKNSIPEYSKNIFKQVIFMFNHYLYKQFLKTTDSWSYSNMKELVNLLKKYGVYNGSFPFNGMSLLNTNTTALTNKSITNDTLNNIRNNMNKKIETLQNEINLLMKRNAVLNEEKTDLLSSTDIYDVQRVQVINAQIADNTIILTNNQTALNGLKTNLQIFDTKAQTSYVVHETNLKLEIKNYLSNPKRFRYTKFIDEYEGVVEDVFNKHSYDELFTNPPPGTHNVLRSHSTENYKGYNMLWNILLDTNPISIEYIHLLITQLNTNLVQKLRTSTNLRLLKPDLNTLNLYYESIIKTNIDLYNKQPPYYDKNDMLQNIMDIIVHVTKYTISSNLYFMVRKYIYNSITNIDSGSPYTTPPTNLDSNYETYLNEVTDKMLNATFRNETIQSYIMTTMTTRLVRKILNIYPKDSKIDTDLTVIEIMRYVSKILINNNTYPLDKDSIIISNLEKYLLSYYNDIYTMLIPMMKQVIENYICYLYNDYRHISVWKNVVDVI